MQRHATLCALLLALAGCGPNPAEQERLAAKGAIDDGAPVQAEAEIIIAAPQAKVWNLLAGIKDWPSWHPEIGKITIDAPPGMDVPFSWSPGTIPIYAKIKLFSAETTMAWSGRLLYIGAIHVWTLAPLSDGRTLVRTRESMKGTWVASLYSQQKLLETDQRWLLRLKAAAER
jgi:uncharacterized protein YndB with AHSA1/START domain